MAQTDQLGNTTQFEHDPAGQLTAVILPTVAHPETGEPVHPAVERLVARYIREDEVLSGILRHTGLSRGADGRFISSPDFIGKEAYNLRLLDITTPAEIPKHLRRPFGPGTDYITHPGLPEGLVFPR